jgi:hypothetical protein
MVIGEHPDFIITSYGEVWNVYVLWEIRRKWAFC